MNISKLAYVPLVAAIASCCPDTTQHNTTQHEDPIVVTQREQDLRALANDTRDLAELVMSQLKGAQIQDYKGNKLEPSILTGGPEGDVNSLRHVSSANSDDVKKDVFVREMGFSQVAGREGYFAVSKVGVHASAVCGFDDNPAGGIKFFKETIDGSGVKFYGNGTTGAENVRQNAVEKGNDIDDATLETAVNECEALLLAAHDALWQYHLAIDTGDFDYNRSPRLGHIR